MKINMYTMQMNNTVQNVASIGNRQQHQNFQQKFHVNDTVPQNLMFQAKAHCLD
jgi:hypothetical protein